MTGYPTELLIEAVRIRGFKYKIKSWVTTGSTAGNACTAGTIR